MDEDLGDLMNVGLMLCHLREAKEELEKIIKELESNKEYCASEYGVHMTHLYHHLNTAWHIRNVAPERVYNYSSEDFDAWGKFPAGDEYLMVDNV